MIFEEKYIPLVEDYTSKGCLSIQAVLRIFEHVGSHHSDSVNDGLIEGSAKGIAWIITEWRVKILKRPAYDEALNASTWATTMYNAGRLTVRGYTVTNNDNIPYIYGSAKFVLMDTAAGKLTRITNELIEKYKPEENCVFDDNPPRLREPESYVYEKTIALRRGDIDFNGHVHNTTYLSYALETIPEEIYEADEFTDVRIVYHRPVKYTESVKCKYAVSGNNHIVGIYGQNDELCCLVELAVSK